MIRFLKPWIPFIIIVLLTYLSIILISLLKEDKLIIEIKPIELNGILYISVKDMATITNRTDQTIYSLINNGNCIRKMKSRKIGSQVFIPYTEVVEFPFTSAGRNASDNVYHYTYEGEIIE
ncbi:MAG: hypothetical protein P8Y70_00230 [Candidatus Lokiarchaeota archaeon]